jgi:hypothetical protein
VPAPLATVHAPTQVMLHVPLSHETLAPAPTVCVHDEPSQATSQLGPHVPEQVEPLSQVRRQPVVDDEHASKLQVLPVVHSQSVPLQILLPDELLPQFAVTATRPRATTAR